MIGGAVNSGSDESESRKTQQPEVPGRFGTQQPEVPGGFGTQQPGHEDNSLINIRERYNAIRAKYSVELNEKFIFEDEDEDEDEKAGIDFLGGPLPGPTSGGGGHRPSPKPDSRKPRASASDDE